MLRGRGAQRTVSVPIYLGNGSAACPTADAAPGVPCRGRGGGECQWLHTAPASPAAAVPQAATAATSPWVARQRDVRGTRSISLDHPQLTRGAEVRQRDDLMWIAQLLAENSRYVFMHAKSSCCIYIRTHTYICWRVCWKMLHVNNLLML